MNHSTRHPVVTEDLQRLFAADIAWEKFHGKTILITGAMGLIASYLVEALLYFNEVTQGQPCQVLALVRDLQRAQAHFSRHTGRGDLHLLVQDVSTPLPRACQCDFIVHAAGNATPKKFGADPIGTYQAAVLGTHYLLQHAQQSGCEGFLLLSSGAVHGAVPGAHTVINEKVFGAIDPLDPYACYAESKRMAETMCASWTRQMGLPTRMARLGHTYGPGLRRDDDRAFAEFVFSIVDRRNILLHTDGSAIRPYCYLMDAADALFRILLQGDDGQAYMVANETATCSVMELATLLAQLDPERQVQVHRHTGPSAGTVPNRDPPRPLDTSKLRALGWRPAVDIENGFARTLRSLL